jgi:hypothetical protein
VRRRLLARPTLVGAVAALCLTTSPTAVSAGPLPTTVTAQTSATNVAVGAQVTLSGTVTPDLLAARTAVLQLQTGTGWRELASTGVGQTGAYGFALPTDWYGDHVFRLLAPGTATYADGVSPSRTVSVTPAYAPRGSASAWKRFSTLARWDPCTVVEYRTNLRRAPKGTVKLVNRAFGAVHAATGITFRNAGRTKKVPFSRGSDSKQFEPSGLVVAWTTPKVVKALKGSNAGVGGSTARSSNGGPWRYVYGGVAVDATQKLPAKGFKKGQSIGALLLHEIAHAMGLDHVTDKKQIMYPSLQRGFKGRYEAGDLAGLHAVGAEQGCF